MLLNLSKQLLSGILCIVYIKIVELQETFTSAFKRNTLIWLFTDKHIDICLLEYFIVKKN